MRMQTKEFIEALMPQNKKGTAWNRAPVTHDTD